jgi:cell shape-determining protein MreC
MREKIFFIIASIVFIFLLILSPGTALNVQHFLFRSGDAGVNTPAENLQAENKQLHLELDRLSSIRGQFSTSSATFIPGVVFSKYPFNFKNEMTVNVGGAQGVEKDRPVLVLPQGAPSDNPLESGFLLGVTVSVNETNSVIRTMLDSRWSSSVRIGKEGVDALLSGGVSPTLGLIPKDTKIVPGDSVYSTDSRFPYGLAVGQIVKIRESSDQAFQTAVVGLGYEINKVRSVIIIK